MHSFSGGEGKSCTRNGDHAVRLFPGGTIRVINEEVWKRVEPGEGVKVDDVLLGRIVGGVAFYKHVNEVGVLDKNIRQYNVRQRETDRGGQQTGEASCDRPGARGSRDGGESGLGDREGSDGARRQ